MRTSREARVLLSALATALLALVVAPQALATGANPNAIVKLEQPDGRAFLARVWGDEFIHGYEALNGHTVVLHWNTKTWRYAERGVRGRLKPSDAVVTRDRPLGRKHLRPTRAAFDRARAREGVPPAGKPLMQASPPWAGADTDILFIAVEFTDTGCSFTPAQMQTSMFGGGASGPGDLDAYYNEVSYGDLQLVGTVVGDGGGTADCVNLGNNRAFYNNNVANPDGDDDLVREALADIDAAVNFADFDNNGDGQIDALGIVYAGGGQHDGCATGGGNTDNLWPHSGGVGGGQAVDGGARTVNPFIINSELTFSLANPPPPVTDCAQFQTIGLFAHEFGHSLGIPDLYDTDVGTSQSGVSSWSVMANQNLSTVNNGDTPPHFDPFSKAFLDWITPTVHAAGDRFVESISQVESSGEVHQFLTNPSGFEIGGTGEYFLVENRQNTLFDANIVGCGILVWHIAEDQTTNRFGGHTAGTHRLVDIDEADGLAELDANGGADNGDPFPGSTNNRLFDASTNPNSDLYAGTDTNVRMWVQSTSCASSMDVAFGPNQAPVADAGGPYVTNEGTDVGLTAAGSSDPDGDALTYEWDLDNDGQFDDSTSQTPTFTLVGDDAVRTVSVRVTDSFGSSTTDSSTVTVLNVRPAVTSLSNNGPKPENTAVTISGVISDPGWLDSLTATVDWGDGAGPQPLAGALENTRPDSTLTFTDVAHTYGDDGVFVVTVCGLDDDGAATVPCGVTLVSIQNVDPTAVIDLTGTVSINGVDTFVAHEGQVIPFTADSFDQGSDDRTTTWDWGDGPPSPDTSTLSLNDNAFNPDPDPSPTINPRTVTDPEPHAFGSACLYTVTFAAADDDGGTASDQVAVIIAGNESKERGPGYWQTQYRPRPTALPEARRLCYLAITRFMSTVFSEARALDTVAQAFDVMSLAGNGGSELQKLDRELLAAWLNFANGAFDLTETVRIGNVTDTFANVLATAESVRLNPASTPKQLQDQRNILARMNGA